jgi:hypothetical protein
VPLKLALEACFPMLFRAKLTFCRGISATSIAAHATIEKPVNEVAMEKKGGLKAIGARRWLLKRSSSSPHHVVVPSFPHTQKLQPNSALLTDTYTSPLRAQRGAAKRER